MKLRNLIGILSVTCLLALFAVPAVAAETVSSVTPAGLDNATQYYNAGIKSLSTDDYKSAIDAFNLALAENTTMMAKSDTLMYLYEAKAYAQIQLNQYSDALQTTGQGIVLYSKDSKLWNNQGFALYNLGRYQDAVTAYNQAIVLDGNYTSALVNKAGALYKLGDYQGSAASYRKALISDPNNTAATEGLRHAEAAATTPSPVLVALIAIVIVAAAGAVWYVKFRKPGEQKPGEKKGKEKGKKK
jgi:tetratricopeptide (TPR) repeat protein